MKGWGMIEMLGWRFSYKLSSGLHKIDSDLVLNLHSYSNVLLIRRHLQRRHFTSSDGSKESPFHFPNFRKTSFSNSQSINFVFLQLSTSIHFHFIQRSSFTFTLWRSSRSNWNSECTNRSKHFFSFFHGW